MKRKEKKRGEVRKIMRMKKTETVMDRKREIAGGRDARRTKRALTILRNSNGSRGEKGRAGFRAG